MDLINDFKKVVKIFPILGAANLREIQHYCPCTKKWFIAVKKVISESQHFFKINDSLEQSQDAIKNLIEYTPFNRNLMFAELEIKKNWNSYKITKESWEYLFLKSPDEMVSLAKEIASSSQKELISPNYPFRFGKCQCIYKQENTEQNIRLDKINLLSNLKYHIYFYKDYKESYDMYGKYYSKENYNLLKRFSDIMKNFNTHSSFLSIKKETEKIISSLEDETIANVQKGMEKLGQNVSGLPKWSTQNPDKLIERIDKTVIEVLAATSKLLVFPHDKKQNIRNTSGLYITISILKKIYFMLEENYNRIGDYSPSFQTFLEKFKILIESVGKSDIVFELIEIKNDSDRNTRTIFKQSQKAAAFLHEAAEAFDTFSKELEECDEFKISKNWIPQDTKKGKIKTHKKDMDNLEDKLKILEKKHSNLKTQIEQTNHENESMNISLERSKKRLMETFESIKEASATSDISLNFFEKLMKFFKINYLSKKRKAQLAELKSLKLKYESIETAIKNTQIELKNNEEILLKLNSQMSTTKTQIVYLKKDINEVTSKFSEENLRISDNKELAAALRAEANKLSPKSTYHQNKCPWSQGTPKFLSDCELSSEEIIKKVKTHFMKDTLEDFSKNMNNYESIGKNILSIIVEIQAYGTIYLNNCEQNTTNKFLEETNKRRIEIVKILDQKISEDRVKLSDLVSQMHEKKEKILEINGI